MKKQFLLPLLFLAFMFTGCQEPDDDVDMPAPEKSVEELIQGTWHFISSTTWKVNKDGALSDKKTYDLTGEFVYYELLNGNMYVESGDPNGEDNHYEEIGPYTITEKNNKAYIGHYLGGELEQSEITAISNDKMTWSSSYKNYSTHESFLQISEFVRQ